MEIVGIEIDGIRFLPYHGQDDSTGYFRAFMYYCINNYFDLIIITPELSNKFSLVGQDPVFGQAIRYNRVECFNGVYFSTLSGNVRKESIMYNIAAHLGIDLFVHTDYN